MIGDVNLFFNDYDNPRRAEIDVMIAEESCRHSGYGTEAVLMMMHYGVKMLEVETFYCKINEDNEPSLKLFRRYVDHGGNVTAADSLRQTGIRRCEVRQGFQRD